MEYFYLWSRKKKTTDGLTKARANWEYASFHCMTCYWQCSIIIISSTSSGSVLFLNQYLVSLASILFSFRTHSYFRSSIIDAFNPLCLSEIEYLPHVKKSTCNQIISSIQVLLCEKMIMLKQNMCFVYAIVCNILVVSA